MTPQHIGEEDGFTLPELLITTLLIGIVSLVLLTTMTSMTSITASTEAKSQALASTRTALERIARDLRAANPVNAITSGATSQYERSISFSVYCSGGSNCTGNLRPVTYEVVGNELLMRTGTTVTVLQRADGTSSLPISLRKGAVVNTAAQPVFTFFRRDGTQITTSSSPGVGIPATYFRDCTKKVRIHLVVRAEANQPSKVIDLTTTVTLRNHNEVNPC